MRQFTEEEFREALFGLPQLTVFKPELIVALFLKERISLTMLRDNNGMLPYTYLRETPLSDAIAALLQVEKREINHWAEKKYADIQKLFDLKGSWTSEEWALAFLNFAALRLGRK